MPTIGTGGNFALKLHHCRNWQMLPDLGIGLENLIKEIGLIPLENFVVNESGEKGRIPIEPTDFKAYCEATYMVNAKWDSQNFYASRPEGKLRLKFRPPFIPGAKGFVLLANDLLVNMVANKFGNLYNEISFSTNLSVRTTSSSLTEKFGEKVIELYTNLAQKMIKTLAPDRVWIAEVDENEASINAQDILNRRIKVIYWANYFADNYLTVDEQKVFVNAPVGIVKQLENGIWYQLGGKFEDVNNDVVQKIEDQAKLYFKSLRIERIQWKYRPG